MITTSKSLIGFNGYMLENEDDKNTPITAFTEDQGIKTTPDEIYEAEEEEKEENENEDADNIPEDEFVTIQEGQAEGKLVGGNLSLTTGLISGKYKNGDEFIPLPVTCVFNAVDSSGTIVQSVELSDSYNGDELFLRTQFKDYDIINVVADVTLGEEKKTFSTNIVKR